MQNFTQLWECLCMSTGGKSNKTDDKQVVFQKTSEGVFAQQVLLKSYAARCSP